MYWNPSYILKLLLALFGLWLFTGCQHTVKGSRTWAVKIGSPFIIEVTDSAREDYNAVDKVIADPVTDWLFKPKADVTPTG